MRALAIIVVVLASCGSGDGDDDADVFEPFDLDVEVHPDGARVWVRRPSESECQPPQTFPRVGECAIRVAPMACDPTATCLRRVALERDGAVLGTAELSAWWHSLRIDTSLVDGPSELVIEGCGASHRLALPAATADRPTLTDIVAHDSNSISGTLTPTPGATSGMAFAEGGIDAAALGCNRPTPDAWSLGTGWNGPSNLTVSSVTDHAPLETPWGVAYIWSIASAPPRTFIVPRWFGTEMQIQPGTAPNVTVLLDGAPYPETLTWDWRVISTPSGFRHLLNGSGGLVRYDAGETTDQVSVLFVTQGGFYRASIPHVVPSNDVEFTVADDGHFELSFGPIALTGSNPPTTRMLTFTMAWPHPLVARPMP